MSVTSRLGRHERTNESQFLSVKHLKNVLWALCFGANHYKMCMETDPAIPANCALHCRSKCRSPHRRNSAHRWRWQLLVALVFCGHNHLNEIFILALERPDSSSTADSARLRYIFISNLYHAQVLILVSSLGCKGCKETWTVPEGIAFWHTPIRSVGASAARCECQHWNKLALRVCKRGHECSQTKTN